MQILIIILIGLILFFLIFIINRAIKNSFWYRTHKVVSASKKRDCDKLESISKYNSNNLTKEDKINFLKELKKEGKVKIPYGAFDYIYRHIDEFGIIDKDGKIVLVNKEAYDNIINIATKENENLYENNKLEGKNYFDIQIGNDGTTVVRDHINKTIKIDNKTTGKTYIAKGQNMFVFDKNEEKKEDDKKTSNSSKQQNTKKTTVPKQQKKEKNIINELTFKDLKEEVENKLNDSTDETKQDNTMQAPTATKMQENMIDINDEINDLLSDDDLKEILGENENTKDEKNNKNKKEMKKYFASSFSYNEIDNFILPKEELSDFISELFSYATTYKDCVIVKNENSIMIDGIFFVMCLSQKINPNQKDKFLNDVMLNIKKNRINFSNFIKILKKFNLMLVDKTFTKLFQIWEDEESDKEFCISKKSYYIDGKTYINDFIVCSKNAIDKLGLNTEDIREVEFLENSKGGDYVSKKIEL